MMHPELDHGAADPSPPVDPMYRWARERAEMIQGLYIHLLIFPIINGGLFLINWLSRGDGGTWWFQWPMMVWGLGLLVHVVVTVFPVFTSEWVDRRAARLMGRH